MTMRKRPTVILVSVLTACLLIAASACGSDSSTSSDTSGPGQPTGQQPSGPPIIIGMEEDSSGPAAPYSQVASAAIVDTIEHINSQGGVLGRPLQLIRENDASDATKAPALVRKMLGQGARFIIMNSGSSPAIQAKPVLQEAKVPFIAPTALTLAIVEEPSNDFAYSLANPSKDFAQALLGAFKATDVKKLGVLADSSSSIQAINKILLPVFEQGGIEVTTQTASVDANDLTAPVSNLKEADPDALLVTALGGQFEVLAWNTVRTLMPDVAKFSLASIGNESASWKQAQPNALDGLVYIGSIDEDNPETQQLKTMLEQIRGDDVTLSAFDAQGYDTVRLIKQAMETAGTDDPVKVNQALQQIQGFPASFGQPGFTLSFSPTKHNGSDGLCGIVLTVFEGNEPKGPWDTYQPPCKQ